MPDHSRRRLALRLALALLAWGLLSWGQGYTAHHAAGFKPVAVQAAAWSMDDGAHAATLSARLQAGENASRWRHWFSPATPAGGHSAAKLLFEDPSFSLDLDPEMPEYAMPTAEPAYRLESPGIPPPALAVAMVTAPPRRLFRPPNLG
jgi:hypothetical protein